MVHFGFNLQVSSAIVRNADDSISVDLVERWHLPTSDQYEPYRHSLGQTLAPWIYDPTVTFFLSFRDLIKLPQACFNCSHFIAYLVALGGGRMPTDVPTKSLRSTGAWQSVPGVSEKRPSITDDLIRRASFVHCVDVNTLCAIVKKALSDTTMKDESWKASVHKELDNVECVDDVVKLLANRKLPDGFLAKVNQQLCVSSPESFSGSKFRTVLSLLQSKQKEAATTQKK